MAQIVFFCDFGLPYTGQMRGAVLDALPAELRPQAVITDLLLDVPAHDVRRASLLLAALADGFSKSSVFVCVVDPGVGSDRPAGAILAGGRWFVGPLGGLFEHTLRRWPADARLFTLEYELDQLSASFHGRDLFAPMAAKIAMQGCRAPGLKALEAGVHRCPDWPDDVAEVIYIDGFGNAITGIHASDQLRTQHPTIRVGGIEIDWARTFSDVAEGSVFAYENAFGLVEIAVNRGNAARQLGLALGSQVVVSYL